MTFINQIHASCLSLILYLLLCLDESQIDYDEMMISIINNDNRMLLEEEDIFEYIN